MPVYFPPIPARFALTAHFPSSFASRKKSREFFSLLSPRLPALWQRLSHRRRFLAPTRARARSIDKLKNRVDRVKFIGNWIIPLAPLHNARVRARRPFFFFSYLYLLVFPFRRSRAAAHFIACDFHIFFSGSSPAFVYLVFIFIFLASCPSISMFLRETPPVYIKNSLYRPTGDWFLQMNRAPALTVLMSSTRN